MTNDERRLLLACATCCLADLLDDGSGPSREQRIAVLRSLIEPFTEFLREDVRRMRKDD
jgi:hypothetical protein